jgi:hypothetical protein
MTVSRRRGRNQSVELLWIVLVVIALITFLVDVAGWFHTGWVLAP